MFQLMDTILRLVIEPNVHCDCHQCLSIAQVQPLQSTLPSQFPWDLLILSPFYKVAGETKTEFHINVHVDPINHKWLKNGCKLLKKCTFVLLCLGHDEG
jgi:hypothetical protein